jgi:hypothetical protein
MIDLELKNKKIYLSEEYLDNQQYKLVSSLIELTEQWCENFVESKELYSLGRGTSIWFMNYYEEINISSIGESKWKFKTAKESFLSFLKQNKIDTNKNFLIYERKIIT